jgi:hypothetical protein
MKVDIRDRATLSGVHPADIAMYLRAHGWAERIGTSERASGDVEIAISWASSRPGNQVLPVNSRFTADTAPILQKAARLLRAGAT